MASSAPLSRAVPIPAAVLNSATVNTIGVNPTPNQTQGALPAGGATAKGGVVQSELSKNIDACIASSLGPISSVVLFFPLLIVSILENIALPVVAICVGVIAGCLGGAVSKAYEGAQKGWENTGYAAPIGALLGAIGGLLIGACVGPIAGGKMGYDTQESFVNDIYLKLYGQDKAYYA